MFQFGCQADFQFKKPLDWGHRVEAASADEDDGGDGGGGEQVGVLHQEHLAGGNEYLYLQILDEKYKYKWK